MHTQFFFNYLYKKGKSGRYAESNREREREREMTRWFDKTCLKVQLFCVVNESDVYSNIAPFWQVFKEIIGIGVL